MENGNDHRHLKPRTRQFALRAINLVEALPKTMTAQVIGRQLMRCALSVGANYRAASRARSKADFVSKMGLVEEEADECSYWLDMLVDANVMKKERLADLMTEANEITAMVVASIRTARRRS